MPSHYPHNVTELWTVTSEMPFKVVEMLEGANTFAGHTFVIPHGQDRMAPSIQAYEINTLQYHALYRRALIIPL